MDDDVLLSLIKSPEIYKKIFDLSPNSIAILDLSGKLLLVNERIYDWLQYPVKDLIGKNFLDLPFLTEEDKENVKRNFANRMKGSNVLTYKVTFHEKSGRQRTGFLSATPIKENGKIVGDLVFVADITPPQ